MAKSLLILIKLISSQKEDNGFTVIELIVVLMIFGILSIIAVPQFSSVTNKAKQRELGIWQGEFDMPWDWRRKYK